jgi:hypothetical protein
LQTLTKVQWPHGCNHDTRAKDCIECSKILHSPNFQNHWKVIMKLEYNEIKCILFLYFYICIWIFLMSFKDVSLVIKWIVNNA